MKNNNYILTVECKDKPGLIYAITKSILKQNANIITNQEFVEPIDKIFFLRAEIENLRDKKELLEELRMSLPNDAEIECEPIIKRKIIILASKEPHCIGDLLLRIRFQEMNAEVEAVISNHEILKELVDDFHVPFYFITHENKDRRKQEEEIQNILKKYKPDYLVLAKYMRILSPEFIQDWKHKIINIHHSFLPAFVGAKPYHQAYERGVKIIGATAHFVNEELDQGPIIAQDVIPVNHSYSAEKLSLFGKDLEKTVLAKALRLVLEKRVMVYKNKTIVFE